MSLPNSTIPVNEPTPPMEYQPQPYVRGDFNYKEYYRWMSEQLTPRISSLAVALLGNPTSKRSMEWRWGKKGEIVVYISGEKMGRFCDFESGTSGDALELVKVKTGYRGKELSDWVKNFIEYQPKVYNAQKNETWVPIVPIPADVEASDILENKYLNYMLKDGNKEVARYAYRDEQGKLKGYVFRFERPNPDDPGGKNLKITPPLAYCQNEKGFKAWRWQGFFSNEKTPYGLEKLTQNPARPVLIVEGEKKADAAQKIFPGYSVLSGIGGVGNAYKINWSCLKDREVTLWPDNDEPGLKCMENLKAVIERVGASSVRVVSLPPDTPQGWDLADSLPNGWDHQTLISQVRVGQ